MARLEVRHVSGLVATHVVRCVLYHKRHVSCHVPQKHDLSRMQLDDQVDLLLSPSQFLMLSVCDHHLSLLLSGKDRLKLRHYLCQRLLRFLSTLWTEDVSLVVVLELAPLLWNVDTLSVTSLKVLHENSLAVGSRKGDCLIKSPEESDNAVHVKKNLRWETIRNGGRQYEANDLSVNSQVTLCLLEPVVGLNCAVSFRDKLKLSCLVSN